MTICHGYNYHLKEGRRLAWGRSGHRGGGKGGGRYRTTAAGEEGFQLVPVVAAGEGAAEAEDGQQQQC